VKQDLRKQQNLNGARVIMHTPEPASAAALYVEKLSVALSGEKVPLCLVCPANHQARVVLETDGGIDVQAVGDRSTDMNVSMLNKIYVNLRYLAISSLSLLKAAKRGDVVHFQYILHLPFGLLFFLCAWLKRTAIVFTVHDPLPHKFLFSPKLRFLEMWAHSWAYRWADLLIVHSSAGKQALTESFRVAPEKIRVIVHGPYELTKTVHPCAETKRLEVLFFGSLRENKAPHLAIEAVQQLVHEGMAVRLTIAGQVVNRKEEEYWEGCRAQIDQESAAVQLIQGFVPDEDLAELFSNCHCLLLPYTTFSSDSGVAYMALANAKPILSTGAGGLGWLLDHSAGGIRIETADVAGVAAALRHAVAMGPAQLEAMGQKGADWVLAECGWPHIAMETRKAYAEFIPQLAAAVSEKDSKAVEELVGGLP
jgi:glycosyltransferase involved in cell wall biosynthesis